VANLKKMNYIQNNILQDILSDDILSDDILSEDIVISSTIIKMRPPVKIYNSQYLTLLDELMK